MCVCVCACARARVCVCVCLCVDPPTRPPLIAGVQDGGHTEGEPLTLFCEVSGGKPPVSSITFWCGDGKDRTDVVTTVGNLTTLTSNVTFDSLNSTTNGTLCRCSATWNKKPSLYAETATATITVIGVYLCIYMSKCCNDVFMCTTLGINHSRSESSVVID